LAIPAVVLEDITASESLGRSSALTKDSVGRIIVIYFLTTIFVAIMVTILNVAGLSIGATALHGVRTLSGSMLQEATSTLGAILFGPITAIALTLAYYDQRVRKEAFDITHMMGLMGVPESLPAIPPPPPIS
jgi:mannose/fructose/N-acetylgalactosamine-specific phosphotransferase system component IID